MANNNIRSQLTALGSITSRPWVFAVVPIYGTFWYVFEHDTFDWHGVATLATWLMTLFIQRSEHRDTQAIHAKLDELLHAEEHASNRMTRVDDEEPEKIERDREALRRSD